MVWAPSENKRRMTSKVCAEMLEKEEEEDYGRHEIRP